MRGSRIRYYESRSVLPEPERIAGKRRYLHDVLRRPGRSPTRARAVRT